MPRLPRIRSQDAVRAFERAGFRHDRQRGSHLTMIHENGRRVVVPSDRRELRPGMLRSLIRDAGMTVDEFVELLRS